MGHTQDKKQFFFSEIAKPDPKLSKKFTLTKYHVLWLSYECFSILCSDFLLKSAISSHGPKLVNKTEQKGKYQNFSFIL